MGRKDLLKKAFRNNFIRKSVADLKSFTTDKTPTKPRHGSSTNLRSLYQDSDPVLRTPRTSTPDFPAHEQTILKEENGMHASARSASPERITAGQDLNEVAQWVENAKPSDSVRILSPEFRRHEDKALADGNPMTMSSSQVRRVMEKADAEYRSKVQSAYFLHGHDQLVSDCRDLFVSAEEMVVSHLDTIDTTLTILKAMEAMSPHVEALRQEMVVKKQMCESQLIDFLPVRSRLEIPKAEKGYA